MTRRLLLATALLCAGCTPSVTTFADEMGRPAEVVEVPASTADETMVAKPVRSARAGPVKFVIRPGTLEKLTPEERALIEALPRPPMIFRLYYDEGTTRLVPSSQPQLEALLAEVRGRGAGVDIQVSGHTDRKGSDADNDVLSQARAEAVLAQLVADGAPRDRMTAVGRGERDPRIATDDGVDEPLNRRTDVIVR